MDYLISVECVKKWNVSRRRVAINCKEGRIEGSFLMGRMWFIKKSAISNSIKKGRHLEVLDGNIISRIYLLKKSRE